MKKLICAILVLFSSAAYSQVVKCIDKSGRVEYTNVCPAGTKQEQIGIHSTRAATTAPSAAPQKPKSLAERDAEFRKRQIEQQEAQAKAQKKLAEDQQRQRACDDARSYLKSLEARNRVAKTDPKTGERVFLEEGDYLREMANARQAIQANCK